MGVAAIRSVEKRFNGDSELLSIPMWVRENRSRACPLHIGDAAPDVPLSILPKIYIIGTGQNNNPNPNPNDNDDAGHTPSSVTATTSLHELCRNALGSRSLPPTMPVVLVAGSVT